MLEIIGIFIFIFVTSFLLMLRKRGIILYIPTQKATGKVTNIITRHRVARKSERHKIDINEDFAIIEVYDKNLKYTAESMFPIVPFDIRTGDIVTVYYKPTKHKVYIKKRK